MGRKRAMLVLATSSEELTITPFLKAHAMNWGRVSPPLATERVMADSPAHRPNERPTGRLVSVVVAALILTGCNANHSINPSGQADRCANDASCDPYDPISYAQNNTGNRGGGGR